MELRNKQHIPIWRDSRYRPEGRTRYTLGGLSLFTIVLLLIPPPSGYADAISFQLARAEPVAWVSVASMMLVLGYLARRLLVKGEFIAFLSCLCVCGALVFISISNPRSTIHLGVFLMLAGFVSLWNWSLFWAHEDPKLLATSLLSTLSILMCPLAFGIFERVLAASSLIAMNVMFYDYIVY